MAAAEGLKIIRRADDNMQTRVKMPGVADKVTGKVDDAQWALVTLGDKVRGVDDDALAVIGGAQFVFNQSSIRF